MSSSASCRSIFETWTLQDGGKAFIYHSVETQLSLEIYLSKIANYKNAIRSVKRSMISDLIYNIYIYKQQEKKCKTAIFHTAGVLHIFVLNNLLGLGTSFYRKSKINIKRKLNYEKGWFHNWPMIISHRLYAFHLQTIIFRYNYKSYDVFYSPNSL